ncbi:MAG: hypothetical protein JW900_14615 [Anaerolineae bacterium]|nr:hypothetical protein [Anaerolineae bacterium]
MSFALFLSLIAPLVGSSILLVAARVSWLTPYRRIVLAAAAGLSFIAVLFVPLETAPAAILSRWYPSAFFGTFPTLLAEPGTWVLALALSGTIAASALVQMGRRPEPRFYLGLGALGMLTTGLAALWAENLPTVVIAWAAFDLAWMLGALAAGLPTQRTIPGSGINALATSLLWAGALVLAGQNKGLSWHLVAATGPGGSLVLVAGLLRLGLLPLHMALPEWKGRNPPGGGVLLVGPLLGWGLLARFVTAGGTLAGTPWVEALAMITFVGGGLLAWTRPGVSGGWPWAGLAAIGGLLWAGTRAGESTATLFAMGGAAWALGALLLHVDRGFDRSAPGWSIPTVIGGLSLLGAPMTMGAVTTGSLATTLATGPSAWRIFVAILGQILLTAAVGRRILRPAANEARAGPLFAASRLAGVLLPALFLLLGGLLPRHLALSAECPTLHGLLTAPGFVGWGIWVSGVLIGAALAWGERFFRRQIDPLLSLLHDFFRLEWLVRLLLDSTARLVRFLGVVADMAEGPGAILWALAIFLLILKILGGS